ncbi:MAG: nuclease domain-containing protein [Pseudomonadota bacterium]
MLRRSAKFAPHCFYCGRGNDDGRQLCLAHSNELAVGRGASHKSHDILGAIVCMDCHDLIDGRWGALTEEERRAMYRKAHMRTLAWWVEAGYLKVP